MTTPDRLTPDALACFDDETMRGAGPAEQTRRRADAYLVGYFVSLGCIASNDGLAAGERDGRADERRRRILDRTRTPATSTPEHGQDR